MGTSSKTIKMLNKNDWYHGTTLVHFHNILNTSLDVEYNKGFERDFGFGFYLTTTAQLAENYISRIPGMSEEQLVIMQYQFSPISYFQNPQYHTKCFEAFDDNFAEFVFQNRINAAQEIQQHPYDIIYGVMSDSVPDKLMMQYRAGDISKEQVLQGLKKDNRMKQLSIHNQAICNTLQLTRAYIFNPITNTRKELEIS